VSRLEDQGVNKTSTSRQEHPDAREGQTSMQITDIAAATLKSDGPSPLCPQAHGRRLIERSDRDRQAVQVEWIATKEW
jgi:hypothetical protein